MGRALFVPAILTPEFAMKLTALSLALLLLAAPVYASEQTMAAVEIREPLGMLMQDNRFEDEKMPIPDNLPLCRRMTDGLWLGYKTKDCWVDGAKYLRIGKNKNVSWIVSWNFLEQRGKLSNLKCWYNGDPMICAKAILKFGNNTKQTR